MWVDYRGPLSIVYNDGEISTCDQTKIRLDYRGNITHDNNHLVT